MTKLFHSQSPVQAKLASAPGIPLRTGRPRLVILGSGWASARLLRDIDPEKYDLTVSHSYVNPMYMRVPTTSQPGICPLCTCLPLFLLCH